MGNCSLLPGSFWESECPFASKLLEVEPADNNGKVLLLQVFDRMNDTQQNADSL